jgi:DNA-binding LacI/PurR family transcriptional regulator
MDSMPNQKELAKLAGVSAGTVSNVISGSKPVSEQARTKVLDAIRKLDYHPNLIARSLKINRTNTLGIVIPDLTVPFFPKLIRGAECAARERGYFLIVLDSGGNEVLELELLSLLQAQRVDGILLVTAAGKWLGPRAKAAFGTPIVCVDRFPEGLKADSVRVDGRVAAEMCVSHLLSLGHREIAVITGPLTLKHEQERLAGYLQALHLRSIKPHKSLLWATTFDGKEIEAACQNGVLRSSRRATALFTTNGAIALDALRSIYALGMSTPNDIGFATIDEIAGADFFQPAITAVVQPAFEMGYRAVELLLERAKQGSVTNRRRTIHLPAKLVARASSALIPH